jgi:nucleoside-diphosphate-sugar epimerase
VARRQTCDSGDVSDAVSANMLAAASQLIGPVNIASGRETRVPKLLVALSEVSARGSIAEPALKQGDWRGPTRLPRYQPRDTRDASSRGPRIGLREGLQGDFRRAVASDSVVVLWPHPSDARQR